MTLTHKSKLCHNVGMNETEQLGPGNQRMVLNVRELYPNLEKLKLFENRLDEFLALDKMSEIIDYSGGILTYFTESVIPSKQDIRPPLILLFGNPAPSSVINKCFFARKKEGKDPPIWQTLANSEVLFFDGTEEDINSFRTQALFNLDYDSPFRIGMAVFYSIPSPASDKIWGGVNGLKKLFRADAFKKITEIEKMRIEPLVQKYVGNNVRGAVVTFQQDAYKGVADCDAGEKTLYREGIWHITESKCSRSDIRLFDVTITRYMRSVHYVALLRYLRDYLGDNSR